MRGQLDMFPVERPLAGCVTPSWHAWAAFQRACDQALARARARHGKRRQIIALRTSTVHAALRGQA